MWKFHRVVAVGIAMLLPAALFGWTSSGPPIGPYDVAGVATDPKNPNIVYASDGNGFFRSDDAGAHWNQLSPTELDRILALDPSNAANLYAGGDGGVVRSVDGGHHWMSANDGLICAAVNSIAVSRSSPNVVYATALNISGTPDQCGGLFRSDDFAEHWSGSTGGTEIFVAVDPEDPEILYVVNFLFSGWGLVRIEGSSGKDLPLLPAGAFTIDPTDATHLYAFGTPPNESALGLYESHDRGDSWQLLSLIDGPAWTSLVVDPASRNVLFAGTPGNNVAGGGVFRSGDGGRSWVPFGLDGEPVYALAIDSKGEFLHASVAGKGIFDQPLSPRVIVPTNSPEPPLPRVHRTPGQP